MANPTDHRPTAFDAARRKGIGWGIFLCVAGLPAVAFGPSVDLWLTWCGIVCVVVGIGFLAGWVTFPRTEMAATPDSDDWLRILPTRTRREQSLTFAIPWSAGAIAATGLCGWARHHHVMMPEETSLAVIGASCWFVVLIICLRRWLEYRSIREPRVWLSTAHPTLDEPFQVRVELTVKRQTRSPGVRVTARCLKHELLHYGRYTQLAVRVASEREVASSKPIGLKAGGRWLVTEDAELSVKNHRPSERACVTQYPFYRWQIVVVWEDGVGKETAFPLTIPGKL